MTEEQESSRAGLPASPSVTTTEKRRANLVLLQMAPSDPTTRKELAAFRLFEREVCLYHNSRRGASTRF